MTSSNTKCVNGGIYRMSGRPSRLQPLTLFNIDLGNFLQKYHYTGWEEFQRSDALSTVVYCKEPENGRLFVELQEYKWKYEGSLE